MAEIAEFTDQSQIKLINESYATNTAEWNKLDADRKWDRNDIEKFAKGFEDTKGGQKDLRTIINLIEGQKLDQEVISTIKDHGLNKIDNNGNIHFNFSQKDMQNLNAEANRGYAESRDKMATLMGKQLKDIPSGRMIQMDEGMEGQVLQRN